MTCVADTSALLASVDADEPEHGRCRGAIAASTHVVVSPLVLAELDFLVCERANEAAGIDVISAIAERAGSGEYEIPAVSAEMLSEAGAIRTRYLDMRLGLTDAVNVVLADRFRTVTLITLDRRHFRAVEPLGDGDQAFVLWPDDLGDR